ncbi:MAG: alpha/beta fold hydrolase [Acidimicrobiales bacterium]
MTEFTASADGTVIAYERRGEGPVLVLVPGALCDRKSKVSTPGHLLDQDFTVVTYDRRGRGDSGDSPRYSVDREIEDLAAVVHTAGGSAFVFGHSSGAILALRAARAGVPIVRLAVYEPPFVLRGTRPRPAADLAKRTRDLIAEGRRADALRLGLAEAMALSPEALASIEASRLWPGLLAIAHTFAYDLEVCGPGNVLPENEMAQLGVPVLVIDGNESPSWARASTARLAAVIPGAQQVTLAGQDHRARAEALAPVLREFYLGPKRP